MRILCGEDGRALRTRKPKQRDQSHKWVPEAGQLPFRESSFSRICFSVITIPVQEEKGTLHKAEPEFGQQDTNRVQKRENKVEGKIKLCQPRKYVHGRNQSLHIKNWGWNQGMAGGIWGAVPQVNIDWAGQREHFEMELPFRNDLERAESRQ